METVRPQKTLSKFGSFKITTISNWKIDRRKRFTASSARLWISWKIEKQGIFKKIDQNLNFIHIKKGIEWEDRIIKFLIKNNISIEHNKNLYIHERLNWIGATPDGFVYVKNNICAIL